MENYQIFVIYWADGAIAEAGVIKDADVASQVIPVGATSLLLPISPDVPDARYWRVNLTTNTVERYTDLQLQKLSTVPPKGFKWDVQLGDFVDGRAKDKVQQDVWEAIKLKRDKRKFGGVKTQVGLAADGVTPVYKWFHSDDGSRLQQMGLVMMGTSIPAGLMWKTMDGTFVEMTSTIAKAVFDAVAEHDTSTFKTAEDHKAAMLAAADPAKYDFSTGWSPIYGE